MIKRTLNRPGTPQAIEPKRKLAPRNIQTLDLSTKNERNDLIKDYKAKSNFPKEEQGKWHFFWGDRALKERYPYLGYRPCILKGEQVHHKGDPLYMIEMEKFDAHMHASEMRSIGALQGTLRGQSSKDRPVVDADGHKHGLIAEVEE